MSKKLLFVHGTGVRKEGYDESVRKIRKRLSNAGLDVEVVECRWGETYGIASETCLSVPRYADTGGEAGLLEADYMWNALLHDPAFEMQQLIASYRRPAPANCDDREDVRSRHEMLSNAIPACLIEDQLDDLLESAVEMVQADYRKYLERIGGVLERKELGTVLARATVARVYILAAEKKRMVPTIQRRYAAIHAFEEKIIGETRGMIRYAIKSIAPLLTPFIVSYRGMLTDLARNQLGDVLRYQARGGEIRQFIASHIRNLHEHEVIVLAHSLGGVASLETLIESKATNVKSFFTFGSQAPLLYELGALSTLPARHPLPKNIQNWINFYDLNDPLSYLAGYLFPGRAVDIQINSGCDFLGAHSAYLESDRMWEIILKELK